MASQVCCETRMDGSGLGTLSSSPNRVGRTITGRGWNTALLRDDRIALPAGHPISWGLLTAGTVLEGSAFADCP
ncbi:MAG: hypothetical protein HIU92_17820 [Proteobacteria bacterium]|nr:hypothetical protein [Pseudomonadota bacterium]